MEYFLNSKDGAYPCEVTIDEDNGRFMVKKADSSGEFFNTPKELVQWIMENWNRDQFYDKYLFEKMVKEIQVYLPFANGQMK